MQDDQESSGARPVVAVAIGVPFLVFAGYMACLVIPVIARMVAMMVVRTVTGA